MAVMVISDQYGQHACAERAVEKYATAPHFEDPAMAQIATWLPDLSFINYCSSYGLDVFCNPLCMEGWKAAVGAAQSLALTPSSIPALQQLTERSVSPEAEGLGGLLSSTLSKMKIIASRKMHPFSFTNPWCGNVLTFNEVHLCRSAGSKGFTETRHRHSLFLPPPVVSLI